MSILRVFHVVCMCVGSLVGVVGVRVRCRGSLGRGRHGILMEMVQWIWCGVLVCWLVLVVFGVLMRLVLRGFRL